MSLNRRFCCCTFDPLFISITAPLSMEIPSEIRMSLECFTFSGIFDDPMFFKLSTSNFASTRRIILEFPLRIPIQKSTMGYLLRLSARAISVSTSSRYRAFSWAKVCLFRQFSFVKMSEIGIYACICCFVTVQVSIIAGTNTHFSSCFFVLLPSAILANFI